MMTQTYFTLNHETTEILNQFPVLKDLSQKNEYGLEEIQEDTETLLQTLQNHKFSENEINVILRKMYLELDRLYKN